MIGVAFLVSLAAIALGSRRRPAAVDRRLSALGGADGRTGRRQAPLRTRRPPSKVLIASLAGALCLVAGWWWAVPLAVAAGWCAPALVRRRRALHRLDQQRRAIADLVDVMAVCAGAGLTVYRVLEVAAARAPPALRPELARVVGGVACGRPLSSGLADLSRRLALDEVATLCRALDASSRQGTPIPAAVEQAADEINAADRRRAEAAARTAPVKMLFPLALLILPSFLLLAAAPLLVTALKEVHP